jgi:tyrosine-specific transport protein
MDIGKVIGGILLIGGTTVGVAMLAFPVATGVLGFFPSLLLFLTFWLYMTYTAFLMLEATLVEGRHGNIVSIARHTLGPIGEAVTWVVYLFLLYALMTAYIAVGGGITRSVILSFFGVFIPEFAAVLPLMLFFGFFVYEGTRSVDLINRILMGGLVLSFCALIYLLFPHVNGEKLLQSDLNAFPLAVSVVSTAFGYQIIIPTLVHYMKGDIKALKWTILIGSLIPLILYILWEFVTLGVIPLEGPHGVIQGYTEGTHGAELLKKFLNKPLIGTLANFLTFFALTTSFLGVSISLTDFLADGLKIKKNPKGRLALFLMTFFPPLVFVLTHPRAFLSALEAAGVFGVVILLGLLPCCMVFSLRYHLKIVSPFKAPGGKLALLLAALFSILVIGLEIFTKWI